MIKIGITASFFYPDSNRTVYGPKTISFVENGMNQIFAEKGVMPILIPHLNFELTKKLRILK